MDTGIIKNDYLTTYTYIIQEKTMSITPTGSSGRLPGVYNNNNNEDTDHGVLIIKKQVHCHTVGPTTPSGQQNRAFILLHTLCLACVYEVTK